ncbi:MAG TPA: hypothetical protein K8V56_20650 [Sporosarcina psychrophila]|uniref:Uncharacterized protein n=1 Tax=Sporosarcina psychrophila TaxID=1476 RepID=A0A921G2Y7_SPOPS|nr:hypothetical protein [Sporosarcina psychrophila]
MTSLQLQEALKGRIEQVVSGMPLSSQEGVMKNIQVFKQHLPRKTKSTSRNPESTFYPCVIVYMDEGENGKVKVLLIVATHDDETDNQGYQDVMNIVEKIMQDLGRNPQIDKSYEMQDEPKWFYNEQDNYPYYFAWIETIFEIPRSLREDVEAMI